MQTLAVADHGTKRVGRSRESLTLSVRERALLDRDQGREMKKRAPSSGAYGSRITRKEELEDDDAGRLVATLDTNSQAGNRLSQRGEESPIAEAQ
jgi:hypothetical protein